MVFKISSSGTFNTLYSFCALTNCADGSTPEAALVAASDGNFYGTTGTGGTGSGCSNTAGCGTIFKITPEGQLTTLYSFCSAGNCSNGYIPSGLVQGSDGNFYGTALASPTVRRRLSSRLRRAVHTIRSSLSAAIPFPSAMGLCYRPAAVSFTAQMVDRSLAGRKA